MYISAWFGRWQWREGHYTHKVTAGGQGQLHMCMRICLPPAVSRGRSWASDASAPAHLLHPDSVAWARCTCGLAMKAASFFLQVTHITDVGGGERAAGWSLSSWIPVCPWSSALDTQLYFSNFKPCWPAALWGPTETQSNILLKTPWPAPSWWEGPDP